MHALRCPCPGCRKLRVQDEIIDAKRLGLLGAVLALPLCFGIWTFNTFVSPRLTSRAALCPVIAQASPSTAASEERCRANPLAEQ